MPNKKQDLTFREEMDLLKDTEDVFDDDDDFDDFDDEEDWGESAVEELDLMEQYDDDEDEPQKDDAFLTPSGPLGGRTSVSVDGKFLGEFNGDEEAVEALKEWMEKNQYWPGVWYVSDHGNINPFTLD